MKFLADENFDQDIVRGVLRRNPHIDIVIAQYVGLSGVKDPLMLEWAAQENRILLIHDIKTMRKYAYARLEQELPLPGVLLVRSGANIGEVIDDLCLIAACTSQEEWEGKIEYVPLS